MNIIKKKEKFLARYDKASVGEQVKVVTFKRKHFNDELSTNMGFGYQDMKEDTKEFFNWLIAEGYDPHLTPDYTNGYSDFKIRVLTTKI